MEQNETAKFHEISMSGDILESDGVKWKRLEKFIGECPIVCPICGKKAPKGFGIHMDEHVYLDKSVTLKKIKEKANSISGLCCDLFLLRYFYHLQEELEMVEQSVEEKEKEDYDDTRKELDKVYDLAWTKIQK